MPTRVQFSVLVKEITNSNSLPQSENMQQQQQHRATSIFSKLNAIFQRSAAVIKDGAQDVERRISKESGNSGSKRTLHELPLSEASRCCTLHPDNKLHDCVFEHSLDENDDENTRQVNDMLHSLLESRTGRSHLVSELTQYNADYALRIRFCVAVNEYLGAENKVERFAKGKSIVTMFVMNGSMFNCSGIPTTSKRKLVRGERVQEELEFLKNLFLDDLVHNCQVQGAITKAYEEAKLIRPSKTEEKEEE